MYPLNDNDLDRLSRDAADQYDVDQNTSTSGWEALETRLNKELPLKEEKERRRFLFWLFFIVLLAGGSLWWMLSGDNTDAAGAAHVASAPAIVDNGKNNNPAISTPSPNQGIAQDDTKTLIDKQSAQQPVEAPVAGTNSTDKQNSTSAAKNTISPADKATIVKDKKGKADRQQDQITIVSPTPSAKKVKQSGALVLADKDRSGKGKEKNISPSGKKGNKVPVAKNGNTEKAPAGEKDDMDIVTGNVNEVKAVTPAADKKNEAGITDTATVIAKAPVDAPKAALKKDTVAAAQQPAVAKKKKENKPKGFEIGLVAGPDMSNVKFTHTDKAGYNIGLQLGYRFSNRWSVNTGLIYTKKNYTADGKDVAKYGWFQNPSVNVYEMDGYCHMLDIPLNVRYDFSVNNKNRYFASTGLSTYIMSRENYTYYYMYNGQEDKRNWDSKANGVGDSTYFFSILNLSAGWEHSLNKHLSLQAEPYLKLPLSQLGHAKLNLSSYGINFSLKYRIAK